MLWLHNLGISIVPLMSSKCRHSTGVPHHCLIKYMEAKLLQTVATKCISALQLAITSRLHEVACDLTIFQLHSQFAKFCQATKKHFGFHLAKLQARQVLYTER